MFKCVVRMVLKLMVYIAVTLRPLLSTMAVEKHCMQDSIPVEVSKVMGMYIYVVHTSRPICTYGR